MLLTPLHSAVEFLTRQLLEAEMEATLEEGGEPVRKDTSPVKKKTVWVEVPSSPHGEPQYKTWTLNPDPSS